MSSNATRPKTGASPQRLDNRVTLPICGMRPSRQIGSSSQRCARALGALRGQPGADNQASVARRTRCACWKKRRLDPACAPSFRSRSRRRRIPREVRSLANRREELRIRLAPCVCARRPRIARAKSSSPVTSRATLRARCAPLRRSRSRYRRRARRARLAPSRATQLDQLHDRLLARFVAAQPEPWCTCSPQTSR